MHRISSFILKILMLCEINICDEITNIVVIRFSSSYLVMEFYTSRGKVRVERFRKRWIEFFIKLTKMLNYLHKIVVKTFNYISSNSQFAEAAMSTKINAQIASSSEYVAAVKGMCQVITSRAIHPWTIFDTTYMFTSAYRKEKRYLKTLHDYTESMIKIRRAELIKENDAETMIKRRPSFLDLLLQSTVDGRPLTNEEIRQEVDTFMFEVRKWLHFQIFL